MKKDNIRDYATQAFRRYAKLGRPTYEQLRQRIYNEALIQSKSSLDGIRSTVLSNPTERAVINAQKAVEARMGELLDILAVEKTLEAIMLHKNGNDIMTAVEVVYLAAPGSVPLRNDITSRVRKASLMIPSSESQVYRWLKTARKTFALVRGLRIEN